MDEMQQYIGTKIVNAKPMNREAYNRLRGWTLPADENGADEGYLVEYIDGDNGILSHFQYYVDLIPFYTLKNLTSNIEVIGNIFENSPNLPQETL